MRLTDAKIRSLKPLKKRFIEWEDGGTCLGVRVAPSGRKSFVFMYRYEFRPRMMTLGVYPTLCLNEARAKIADGRLQLDKGLDPGVQSLDAKRQARLEPTLAALCHEYLEKWAKPRKRTWKEDERIMIKDILPAFGRRKARNIQRKEVISLLDDIVDRGAPISANRTLALLSSIFNFALRRDIIATNPCSQITPLGKETQRERILSEKEIRSLWTGLSSAKMQEPTKAAIRLMLITGQRKSEVVKAAWDEFDIEGQWWTIPAERAKNGLAHRVPLSGMALSLLNELKLVTETSHWLFPSPHKDAPMTPRAVSRALLRNHKIMGIEDFTPHDLRRSVASFMTSCGIARLVVKKVLNHIESDITAVYDRHSYDREKQQALYAWAQTLDGIIAGKKGKAVVIPILSKQSNQLS